MSVAAGKLSSWPRAQAAAMGKGWHGIWDSAAGHGSGRSGGTAVLARRPTQLVRGGALALGAAATVDWTRRTRLHVGPDSNTQATDPSIQEAAAQVVEGWQAYLAGLGSAP